VACRLDPDLQLDSGRWQLSQAPSYHSELRVGGPEARRSGFYMCIAQAFRGADRTASAICDLITTQQQHISRRLLLDRLAALIGAVGQAPASGRFMHQQVFRCLVVADSNNMDPSLWVQVIAARSYSVVPVVEGLYDMGNLAAVCRSADGKRRGSRC
jgi:hypothetical protein